MSELIRSAKSASDWAYSDLYAYNVAIRKLDAPSFFGNVPAILPPGTEEFCAARDRRLVRDEDAFISLRLLEMTAESAGTYESVVDDLAMALFRMIGYVSRVWTARSRMPIRLTVCGETRSAQTDLCLLDDQYVVLLVQEDKRYLSDVPPEPQLIAEAIAAFQQNNTLRKYKLGTPELEEEMIPGIIMVGAFPVFYKITVTRELANCVASGKFPKSETCAVSCSPPGGEASLGRAPGMADLECRGAALRYFESFKQFIGRPRPAAG
jgi:hypothetical protein